MTKEQLLQIVKYDSNGLIPVIAQDYHSKKVRMLAYMNEEALKKTLETGNVYYFSRSRNRLWLKGETSGHYQYLKGIQIDCDGDTLLIQIEQVGGISCHTGASSCFYRKLNDEIEIKKQNVIIEKNDEITFLDKLYNTIVDRKNNPKEGSYTNYLIDEGINKILKKVGEESTEIVIAAKDQKKQEIIFEIADFMYHLTVLMEELNISWQEIENELKNRE